MNRTTFCLSLLILMLFSPKAISQDCPQTDLLLSTRAQLDSFRIRYPDCSNFPADLSINSIEGVTDLQALQQLETINGDLTINACKHLINLNGLENLSMVGGKFTVAVNDSLVNLDGIGQIEQIIGGLFVISNPVLVRLTPFPQLRGPMEALQVQDCPLFATIENIDSLKELKQLYISNCGQLENLSGLSKLEKVTLSMLIVNNARLQHLRDLQQVKDTVENLAIYNNSQLKNLAGLDSITAIPGYINVSENLLLENVDGLQKVSSCPSIGIINNPVLNSISGLRNISPESVTSGFRIEDNSRLRVCTNPLVCDMIVRGGPLTIHNNAPGCDALYQVEHGCRGLPYRLYYRVFIDINRNGVADSGEFNHPRARVVLNPGDTRLFVATDGHQELLLDSSVYQLSYDDAALGNIWQSTGTSAYQFQLNASNPEDTLDFGIAAREDYAHAVNAIIGSNIRCGQWVPYTISTQNLGSATLSGILWLDQDNLIEEADYDMPPDTMTGNKVGWFFSHLLPGHTFRQTLSLRMPLPGQFQIGDSLQMLTYSDYQAFGSTRTTQRVEQKELILCAYDPNDKLVSPSREGFYTLFEEALVYTIRFQNTGNAEAYDVVIRDTLDQHLDPESFQYLISSHPEVLQTTLQPGGVLEFAFRNIFLPDSTADFEGSQGFVSYTILPLDSLPENTTVTNRAGIYFDFNPPIITNQTTNIMVSELPVTVGYPTAHFPFPTRLFPNPTADLLTIESLSTEPLQLELLNALGQVIIRQSFEQKTTLPVGDLPNGIYWIRLSHHRATILLSWIKNG